MPERDRLKDILNVLLVDYENARTEMRASEARHEKVSLWLSSGLLVALAACFQPDFNIGFVFLPLVIIAYWAHRIYAHTLHTATLSKWVMRIEDLVDELLETEGLLNWKRYFCRLKLGNVSIESLFSAHYFIEVILLLPSVLVFLVSLYFAPGVLKQNCGVSTIWAYVITWGTYPMVVLGLAWVAVGGRKEEIMERARRESVSNTLKSIKHK